MLDLTELLPIMVESFCLELGFGRLLVLAWSERGRACPDVVCGAIWFEYAYICCELLLSEGSNLYY